MIDIEQLIAIVDVLMKKAKISIRDTWIHDGIHNHDDWYLNNGYNGSFNCPIIPDGKVKGAQFSGNKLYTIPQFSSVAYDDYKILVHPSYSGNRLDPIVHEIVHLMQHNTTKEGNEYGELSKIDLLGAQDHRLDLEAYYIQCMYIATCEKEKFIQATGQDSPLIDGMQTEEFFQIPYNELRSKNVRNLFRNLRLI